MDIKNLQKNWNAFGKMDALWAILQAPDKKGKKWKQEEFFKSGAIEIDAVMQHIESLGVSLPRGRALDFGCGVGRLTQGLARYFANVDGIDIAPSMIALAREYNQHGDKCTYHLNEATDLTLFPEKALISFIQTLHCSTWSHDTQNITYKNSSGCLPRRAY